MPLANPLKTDASGNYHFFALAGPYDIQISGNLVTTYTQTNVPVPCIPGATGCSGGGGGGTPCTATALSIQFNNAGTFGCVDISFYSATNHAITLTANSVSTTPLALATFSTSATTSVEDISSGPASPKSGLFSVRGVGVPGYNSSGSPVLLSSVASNATTLNQEFCNATAGPFYCVNVSSGNTGSFFIGNVYGAMTANSSGLSLSTGSSPDRNTVIQNNSTFSDGISNGNALLTLRTVGWPNSTNSSLSGGGIVISGTSGGAGIGVAAAAGSPCTILLPTISPTTGQVLSSAAPVNNACQTSWITSSGGGGGSNFPVTVSGTVNSGGIPCFNSITNEQTSALLGTGQFVLGGGVGACPSTSFSVIPVVNGGTAASTSAGALINLFPTAGEIGDIIYCATYSSGCTSWALLPGNTSGTQFLQETSGGVPSWSASASTVALSSVTAATGTNSINNANYKQSWNWHLTGATSVGLNILENSASTGGTALNQYLTAFSTAPGSTAIPAYFFNSLNGSQTLPAVYIAPVWNTTGVVDAALLVNITNTASGAGSKILDLQIGSSSVFAVDKSGNITASGYLPIGNVGTAGLSGTSPITISSAGAIGCATCVTSASLALSSITAASTTNTIASGNNYGQIWNWALTSNSHNAMQWGETTAATNGTLGNQYIGSFQTAAGSTAVPLNVTSSLTGSQTLPSLYITPTWNTTGVVDAALLVNVTNTASGAASKLFDFQIGGTSEINGDKAGNINAQGAVSLGASPPGACGTATACDAFNEGSTSGSPASSQDYYRADSTKHYFTCSFNNSAELGCLGPQSTKWMNCSGKGLGDGLNAIPSGTYLMTTCKNISGVTITITGVQCLTDNNGSSTLNAAGNTLGALLTGAVTCTTSYAAGTQSANVLLTANDYIKFTFVADGTSKQSDWVVSGTF